MIVIPSTYHGLACPVNDLAYVCRCLSASLQLSGRSAVDLIGKQFCDGICESWVLHVVPPHLVYIPINYRYELVIGMFCQSLEWPKPSFKTAMTAMGIIRDEYS